MKWLKRGLLFAPPSNLRWMRTHAALPCADSANGALKVYFSGRDEQNRAHIGWFMMGMDPEPRVLSVSECPVLMPGETGCFDDHGVTSSCIIAVNSARYLYYTGWSLGQTVPFYLFVGLAVSNDGGVTFERVSKAPILERCHVDPYVTASPCVLLDGGMWRMWYVSGSKWQIESGRTRHFYHIRYAESNDGVQWKRSGIVCIDYKQPGEHAIARPWVVKDGNLYRMWYCRRGHAYRLGYAESADGIGWVRKDSEVSIEPSSSGWDSEMIAYPFVFDHGSERYMLYNGNGYGATGIGCAVQDQA